MKKTILIMAAALISIPVFASVVTIEGKSVIISDKPDVTKERAIEATLQKAVEAYVVERATKATADANYPKLQPAIYSSFKDFVAKYEIVAEREDGQFHYVNARVEIDDAKINGQLAAIGIQPGIGGKPKVAVFASEQNVDGAWVHSFYETIYSGNAVSEANFNICEGVVITSLGDGGFPVIDMTLDPTETRKAFQYKPVFDRYDENMFNMPNESASKLAKVIDNDVELVVTCSALAKNQGKKSAYMNSIFANVSCKATNVKTNTRVAFATAEASSPHVDPVTGGNQALQKACGNAGKKLTTALSDKFR
jgi:hypothetical protein